MMMVVAGTVRVCHRRPSGGTTIPASGHRGARWQAGGMTTGLVLGGGGVTGIAWEIGLLKGLRDRGADLTGADTVIGTSAGSVVGAQVTSDLDLDDLYADQTTPAHAEIGASFGGLTLLKLITLMAFPGSPLERRRRIGRAARKAHPE